MRPLVGYSGRLFRSRCMTSRSASRHPNPLFVNANNAPDEFDPSGAVVYDSFISDEEGESLVSDILGRMRRRRYEKGHWDAVIMKYKEVELLDESELQQPSRQAMDSVREQLLAEHLPSSRKVSWLPCHAIDLKKDGELKPHVDSVKFSGDVVSGISLVSSSIMRLKPEAQEDVDIEKEPHTTGWIDLYLPPLSLYVLSGATRYHYTHELLPCGSVFESPNGESTTVTRDHRLSVIFRDAKDS